MSIRRIISSPLGPKPLAPYSQAVQVDKTLYVSGMLGTDQNSKLVDGGIVAEAKIALTNLGNVLGAAGTSFGNVVKTTVLVSDLNDFATVNDIYKQFFKEPYPARVSYQVAKLPLGAKIEVDAIAIVGDLETVES